MQAFWSDWRFWLLTAAFIPYATFAVTYGLRAPWYRSQVGRSLLLSKAVIAATLLSAIVGRMFPHYTFRWGLFALLIGLAVVAGWYQLITLLQILHRHRSEPDAPRRRVTDRK